MSEILKISNVSKIYNNKFQALDNLSLNIKKGEILTEDKIDIRRPGTGIEPKFFDDVLGKKTNDDIPKDVPITFDMIEKL